MASFDPEEDSIISRAQGGDKKAFELLYRRFAAPVYSLSLKITGSSELAEDLTQEVFVTAWKGLALFKKQSMFYTWLYRLAVRVILRKKASRNFQRRSDISVDSIAEDHTTSKAKYDSIDKIDIQRAISRLPLRTRSAVILFDIEGYSHKEISGMLGIREGTSKALVHRGRAQLKRELTK